MSTAQLLIPDRIKVGFDERDDTFTKFLAYVIYRDGKGVWRKETSWEGWRDNAIEPKEFDNEPLDGFVLNKGVGGKRGSWSHDVRNEYIRVYDPRDFEFEISVANLLFILRECDCNKGKGLEGKFCYAWDKTELVLLPVGSEDYQKSKGFTELQTQSVKAKELIPGACYVTRKQEKLIFLGKFDYFFRVDNTWCEASKREQAGVSKKFVFWSDDVPPYSRDAEVRGFVFLDNIKSIAAATTDTAVSNYAELVDSYRKSYHGSRPVRLFLEERTTPRAENFRGEGFYISDGDGFVSCQSEYSWSEPRVLEKVFLSSKYEIVDGRLVVSKYSGVCYHPDLPLIKRNDRYSHHWRGGYAKEFSWIEPVRNDLMVELESGSVFHA